MAWRVSTILIRPQSTKIERVVISIGISQVDSKKAPPSITKRAPKKLMNIAKIYEEDPPRT
jgi:hypothetical protein